MELSELQDAVDFEVKLTKLILKRAWAHEYTSMMVVAGKSVATVSGVMKLTDKHLLGDDHGALANDIKHQIAHFISGIRNEHNFNWQFIANKLGVTSELIELRVKEVQECRYCGEFTVLVKARMCHKCKTMYDAVSINTDLAYLIITDIEES
jgi:hypothetical protein